MEQIILDQLDRAALGHNTFTQEALALIVRSGEGLLRRTRNLCLSSLIEAVRDQTRTVDLKQVSRKTVTTHHLTSPAGVASLRRQCGRVCLPTAETDDTPTRRLEASPHAMKVRPYLRHQSGHNLRPQFGPGHPTEILATPIRVKLRSEKSA
jgi:hypothetical protein